MHWFPLVTFAMIPIAFHHEFGFDLNVLNNYRRCSIGFTAFNLIERYSINRDRIAYGYRLCINTKLVNGMSENPRFAGNKASS